MKLHMDLDCYFVSAERTRYPFLNNRPVVVCKGSDKRIFANTPKRAILVDEPGAFNASLQFYSPSSCASILNQWKEEFKDSDGAIHGMVIAKSYEAKKFGIKTGTPLKDALVLCPHLIVLPSDHLYYQMLSMKLKAYLQTKIPLLEQYSIDEFFADLGGWVRDEDTYGFCEELQREILEIFALPISIAASKSKWIAKLATDTIKPYGIKVIEAKDVNAFVDPIAITEFPGIGHSIQNKLHSYGLESLKDAKRHPKIFASYGKTGRALYLKLCGEDNEPVHPSRERKGIGISRNFPAIIDRCELERRVMILSRYLSHTITKLSLNPTTFYCKIRYQYGSKSAKSITHDRLFNEAFFMKLAQSMFKQLDIHPQYKIHYIGLGASRCVNEHILKSFSLLEIHSDIKHAKLTKGLTKIRDKYGIDSISYAKERLVG